MEVSDLITGEASPDPDFVSAAAALAEEHLQRGVLSEVAGGDRLLGLGRSYVGVRTARPWCDAPAASRTS